MKIYQSFLFDNLTKQLAETIKHSDNTIFQPEYIVGANVISKTYIKEQLALHNSIAANLKFVSWDILIHTIFRLLKPTGMVLDNVSPITAKQFIYNTLSDESFVNSFRDISNYYKDNRKKQHGLAVKVAGLFQNYLKFYPELLEQWSVGKVNDNHFEENWQYVLWQKYQEYLKDNLLYDTFGMLQIIHSELDKNTEGLALLAKHIPSIHFLKNEKTTHFELNVLTRIAPFCKVYVYDFGLNQAKKTDNYALNVLWSKSQTTCTDIDSALLLTDTACAANNTDLSTLQNTILQNAKGVFNGDESIQVHGHFTVFREIEGLLNSLIATYQSTDLIARDIIVYCNDIEQYIPAIHYFFNFPAYTIPYRILGETDYRTDTPVHALSALLNYDVNTMDPEQMLILLEYPSISSKFGIADTALLREWIQQANIRFQYEGDKDIEMQFVSWSTGLDRLLYGSCTGVENWYTDDILTLDVAEADTMDVLISFRYFVEHLHTFLLEAKKERNIGQWITFTTAFIEFFFENENEEALKHFTESLTEFYTYNSQLESFGTWLAMLQPVLEASGQYISPANGGITFMELKNVQVLPAQFTAILGLNYNNYPVASKVLDFDLLKNREEYITKSEKEQNKFSLLAAIIHTSKTLYLSYQSHSPLSNESKPASILVEQLLDFINTYSTTKIDVIHHPLQRYNTRYNIDSKLISYTQNKHVGHRFIEHITYNDSIETTNEVKVSINKISTFFTDSFKYFYTYNLGIYFDEEESELAVAEDFMIEAGLGEWAIRDYVFSNHINWFTATEENKAEHLKLLKVSGQIPLNHLGEVAVVKAINKYIDLYNVYFELVGIEAPQTKVYNYAVEVGTSKYIFEGNAMLVDNCSYMVCYNSNICKRVMEWLFSSYILLKQGVVTSSYLVLYDSMDKRKRKVVVRQMTRANLKDFLSEEDWNELFVAFHKGTQTFEPYYLLAKLDDYLNEEEFFNAVVQENFLSPYCASEIYKESFRTNKYMLSTFYNNYKKVATLIKKVRDEKY